MAGEARLRVDLTACTGHGGCAVLFGERIELDEWGYPIVGGQPVPAELVQYARAAVAACPTRALRLTRR